MEWLPIATHNFSISYTSQDDIVYKISSYNVQPITNYGLFHLMLNFSIQWNYTNLQNYNSSNNNSQILNAYKWDVKMYKIPIPFSLKSLMDVFEKPLYSVLTS